MVVRSLVWKQRRGRLSTGCVLGSKEMAKENSTILLECSNVCLNTRYGCEHGCRALSSLFLEEVRRGLGPRKSARTSQPNGPSRPVVPPRYLPCSPVLAGLGSLVPEGARRRG